MLSYVLNKQIDANKIISDIQDLVSKQSIDPKDSENHILVIQIRKVSYTSTDHILKITHTCYDQV